MNSRRKIIIGIGVFFIVVVTLLVLFWRPETKRQYNSITTNLQHHTVIDGDVYYFTSTYFMKYNTTDNSYSQLSDALFIKNGISFASYTKDGVVFQTNPETGTRDDITTAATTLNTNKDVPHWWRYDFITKKYQLISSADNKKCSSVVEINPEQLSCITTGKFGESSNDIYLINKGGGKKIVSSNGTISTITTNNNELSYIETSLGQKQSIKTINLTTNTVSTQYKAGENQKILSYKVVGDITAVNQIELLDKNSNFNENSEKETATPFQQSITVLSGKKVLYTKNINKPEVNFYTSNGELFYSTVDGSIYKIDAKNIVEMYPPTTDLHFVGDYIFHKKDSVFKIDNDNTLSSTKNNTQPSNYKKPSLYTASRDNDPSGASWVMDESGGVYSAYVYKGDIKSSLQQKAVTDLLEKKGFRVSEFNFEWSVTAGDAVVPIIPTAELF